LDLANAPGIFTLPGYRCHGFPLQPEWKSPDCPAMRTISTAGQSRKDAPIGRVCKSNGRRRAPASGCCRFSRLGVQHEPFRSAEFEFLSSAEAEEPTSVVEYAICDSGPSPSGAIAPTLPHKAPVVPAACSEKRQILRCSAIYARCPPTDGERDAGMPDRVGDFHQPCTSFRQPRSPLWRQPSPRPDRRQQDIGVVPDRAGDGVTELADVSTPCP